MEVKIKRYKSGKNNGSIRKNEVKLDREDSWGADWTIAQIAAPLLVQLQETKHGAPFVDDEDTGLGEIKSLGVERIPEMEQPNKEYHQRIQKGCVLFGKYFQNLWS